MNTPSRPVSSSSIAAMYSFTRWLIESHEVATTIGVRIAVSSTISTLIPSTPSR